MSSPPANFFAKFSAFFLFPQVLHSCFGQAARIFCRFLAFFTKAIPPAAPAFRSRTAFRQRGRRLRCLRFAVTARTIFHAPPPVENARFLSVFALHSFLRFPRGNFVEFIKFSTIGVDFPQMMWYTIILRIPVERQGGKSAENGFPQPPFRRIRLSGRPRRSPQILPDRL